VNSYRSLAAWQRAHAAALLVLRVTNTAYHARSRSLFDQLKRAAVSVEANIVEGYALGSAAQCRRHLWIAMGSAAEAECLTHLAAELEYLPASAVPEILELLGGTMRTLRGLLKRPPHLV
jgi:four helix bundle protein